MFETDVKYIYSQNPSCAIKQEDKQEEMASFTMWDIVRFTKEGVLLRGIFGVARFAEMNDDEIQWAYLFEKGVKNYTGVPSFGDEDYDDYVNSHSRLECYGNILKQSDNDESQQSVDNDTNRLNQDLEHKLQFTDNPLIARDMIHSNLVDIDKFFAYLQDLEGYPPNLVDTLRDHVELNSTEIGFGVQWVKMSDIDTKVDSITTMDSDHDTDTPDKKKKILKNREDASNKYIISMGLGDEKEVIGEVMIQLKESCVDIKSDMKSIEVMETDMNNGLSVDVMKQFYHEIDRKLASVNNCGLRLVSLRGKLFGLYMSLAKVNAQETASFFGVSKSFVNTSRSFASLTVKYPAFNRVTLPFTVVVRNMPRINKWFQTASDEDK